jgi:hypothetical protein
MALDVNKSTIFEIENIVTCDSGDTSDKDEKAWLVEKSAIPARKMNTPKGKAKVYIQNYKPEDEDDE